MPAGRGDLGHDRGEHQTPVQDGDGDDAHQAEHGDRQDLARADAQDLAEQQREDLRLVLVLWLRNAAPSASIITRASAVTTSGRPRRLERRRCRARRRSENTPSPRSGLTPIRLAPAAPAKAPLGMAWAGKAAPRSTTKKPTTPATRPRSCPTSQALIMKPENIRPTAPVATRAVRRTRPSVAHARDAGARRTTRGPRPGTPRTTSATMKKLTGQSLARRGPVDSCRRRRGCRATSQPTPRTPASDDRLTEVRVIRSAVAAGPMSSAVERIEPMAIDDRPTAPPWPA